MTEIAFKKCTACNFTWGTRNAFLSDPGIAVHGYQANLECLKEGLFLFKHISCHSTISLPAGDFIDLYDGPMFEEPRTGKEGCPGYCLNKKEMRRCPEKCACAFVREVLQLIKNWPKS